MTIQQVPEGICHRCGTSIKYVFEFDGHIYGSKCIEVVTGIAPNNWKFVDGKPNYEASKKSEEEKEAERQEFIYRNTILHQQRQATKEANQIKFSEVLEVLRTASKYDGDFCYNMAEDISRDGSTSDLYEILGHKCYNIVREIWGKQTGGRRNSKKYNQAVEEFDRLYEEE